MKRITAALAITLLALTAGAEIKVEIKKHGVNFNKIRAIKRIAPYTTLTSTAIVSEYGPRPYVTSTILVKEHNGSLALVKLYYNWDKNDWNLRLDVDDPISISKGQPPCDYKTISNKTLRNKETTIGEKGSYFEKTPKILAYTSRIYIDGKLAHEKEHKKRECPIKDWENI